MEWFCHKRGGPAENKPAASYINYEEEVLRPLWSCGKIRPGQWHKTCYCNAYSISVEKTSREAAELLAVCCLEGYERCQHPRCYDYGGRSRKRVVAAHAMSQEDMLLKWMNFKSKSWMCIYVYIILCVRVYVSMDPYMICVYCWRICKHR